MIRQITASVTLAICISLALNPIFALADSATTQTMSSSMGGFAFTNGGCCQDTSSSMNGKMMTDTDGTIILLQQTGTIKIGSQTYQLEFNPSNKTTKEMVSDDCSSSPTYQQSGEIIMVGNNGTIFSGSGVYSWGTFPSCSGDKNSFTNFSGSTQDSVGNPIEFYTGTSSLPQFQ